MTEQPPTMHPLVASYLDELSRLLVGIDPAERAEVVEGVREHIESTLEGTAHTDAAVRAALAEVGPAQDVADEAYAGRPGAGPAAAPLPVSSRRWLPSVVAGLEAVAVLVVVAAAGSSASVTSSTVSSVSAAGGPTTSVTQSSFEGSIGSGLLAFVAAFPFWLVVVVMVGVSALWSGREKLALIAVMPACALAFAVLPEVGYKVFGINGVYAGGWLATGLSVLGGGLAVGVLVRRAHRRSTARASR
ncbi:MAG: hypothetical protein QOF53_2155 [Nocardioidaceae bacterium]|nr:hypothetical protein [Nocardioidaceae bacterium]